MLVVEVARGRVKVRKGMTRDTMCLGVDFLSSDGINIQILNAWVGVMHACPGARSLDGAWRFLMRGIEWGER